MCASPHQVWPLRSECCGRGVPTKVVCAECMKMCCLGGKNSVVKGLTHKWLQLGTYGKILHLVLYTTRANSLLITLMANFKTDLPVQSYWYLSVVNTQVNSNCAGCLQCVNALCIGSS